MGDWGDFKYHWTIGMQMDMLQKTKQKKAHQNKKLTGWNVYTHKLLYSWERVTVQISKHISWQYFPNAYEKMEVNNVRHVFHGCLFEFTLLPSFLSAYSGINGVQICWSREKRVVILTNNHWCIFPVLRVKPHYLRSVVFKRYWVFCLYNSNVKVDESGILEIMFLYYILKSASLCFLLFLFSCFLRVLISHMLFLSICRTQIMDALRNKLTQDDEDSR